MPVIALVAGTSSAASSLAWMEPFRPYLIGLTVLSLAFVWYQTLKPVKADDCGCEVKNKTPFMKSKAFLSLMTLFAIAMLAFPYYSKAFYANPAKPAAIVAVNNTQTVEFKIKGMSCVGCEDHVKGEVYKQAGISKVEVSYANKNAVVQFDKTKTTKEAIQAKINSIGYTVTETLVKK